jgi:hypothetical protein
MKLFVFALAARRIVDGQYEVGIRTAVVLNQTETDALQEAWQSALNTFPETDAWHEHEIVPQEIPQDMLFDDGHRLKWHVDKPSPPLRRERPFRSERRS